MKTWSPGGCLLLPRGYKNHEKTCIKSDFTEIFFNPSHAAFKILINATAAEFICKNIFPTPVQVKKMIKNKIGDIQQIYLYQNVCK